MNNNDQNPADDNMQPAAPMGDVADASAPVTDPNAASAPVAPADTTVAEPMAPAMGEESVAPAADEPAVPIAEEPAAPAEPVVSGTDAVSTEETGGGDTTPAA